VTKIRKRLSSFDARIVTVDAMTEKREDTIPRWVLWWTALAALALFVYLVRSVLPPFVIGFAFAYVFSPVVDSIQDRWRLPRGVAILGLYLALLVPLVALVVIFGPRLVEELRLLIVRAPQITAQLVEVLFGSGPYLLFGSSLDARQVSLALVDSVRGAVGSPENALRVLSSIAELTLNAFLTLVVSIYVLADSVNVRRAVMSLVPRRRRPEIDSASKEIHLTLARYLRRQLFLVCLVSFVTFLGLELLFNLRYALAIAVVTGFLEVIPFFGPVVAGSIAALVALSQGGSQLMIEVIVFYVVLRQIEDQLVSPVVLGRAVELHPLVVIFAVLAGGALFGVIGTLAAIPVAAAIKVALSYWPKLNAPPVAPADGTGTTSETHSTS
jgi:predicted PurR-regulated permease PerM